MELLADAHARFGLLHVLKFLMMEGILRQTLNGPASRLPDYSTCKASSRLMWIRTVDVFILASPGLVTSSRLTFLLPALELIGFRASQGSDVHVHVLTHMGAYQLWRVLEKR